MMRAYFVDSCSTTEDLGHTGDRVVGSSGRWVVVVHIPFPYRKF